MQSSLRPKTKYSQRKIPLNQNLQNLDLSIDLISPWNDTSSRVKQASPSPYNPFNNTGTFQSINGKTQNLKRIRIKNSRIKTEQSKHFSFKKMEQFGEKFERYNDKFFAVNFIRDKIRQSPVNLKKSRHIVSRQKFRTPVINLNEYSFTDQIREQFASIIPRTFIKQKVSIKNSNTTGFRPSFKQNANFTSTRINKTDMRKISTQKVIPFYKSPLHREKTLKKTIYNNLDANGVLAQNLRRIMHSKMEPVVTKIKSKSMNKFNKTFY